MRSITANIRAELESEIGKLVNISQLHQPWIRKRESYRPHGKRAPKVFSVTTSQNKKFKLLLDVNQGIRLARIEHYAGRCAEMDFISAPVASGENWLLLNYIEGVSPDFRTPKFAYNLGWSLAVMHEKDKRQCDSAAVFSHFENDMSQLYSSSLLTKDREITLLYKAITLLDLSSYPTSIDYFDIKPSNFIEGRDGKIYFVDLGAIGENRPTGQFLFGSFHYEKLNQKYLFEGYRQGGGDMLICDNAVPLRILNCIWLAAHYYRRATEIPLYAAPIKYGFQIIGRRLVAKSLELASVYR